MPPKVIILPGLPAYGNAPERFSATGIGAHSEGLVVEIRCNETNCWIGNFVRGMTSFDWVGVHPNGTDVLVIAGGQGYLIEPDTRSVAATFGGAIEEVIRHEPRRALVFNHQGLHFDSLGPDGIQWTSKRISWDGFRDIAVSGSVLTGQASDAVHDTWRAFRLDLETGEVVGGAYPETL